MPRRGPLIGGDNTIMDPEYAFADDGDPLGARNRATVEGQRADAKDAAQQERDRQLQFILAQYGQDQQNARLAYTTQAEQQAQAQRQAVEARGQDMTAQQRAAETQQWAQKDYQDFILRGYDAEQNRNQSERHFQQTGAEQAYQFDAAHAQSADQFDRAHQQAAEQFALSRQPSERDQYEADRRMTEMQAAQQFQAQEMQARFKLQSDLHDQQLSQEEKMRLQRMQTGLAKVQADLDAGRIEPWVADEARAQLQYGISPLKQRAAKEQMLQQQMLAKLHYEQAMRQMHTDQMAMDFNAKTFAERVGTFTDPTTGQTLRFYQKEPSKWEPLPDKQGEKEAAQDERLYKFQEAQLRHHEQQSKSVFESQQRKAAMWDKADQANRKRLEDMIDKAGAEWAKARPLEETEPRNPKDAPRAKALQAEFDKNHEADMRRHFKTITGKDAVADEPAELQFHQWLDRTHQPPPLPEPYVPQRQRPAAPPPQPPNSFGGQRLAQPEVIDRTGGIRRGTSPDGGAWSTSPEESPAPEPVGAMPRPEQQAGPPAAGGALQQIDQMIDEARGGNQAVYAAATRIKAVLSKYRTIDQMPVAEREQYLRDKRIAGLGQ